MANWIIFFGLLAVWADVCLDVVGLTLSDAHTTTMKPVLTSVTPNVESEETIHLDISPAINYANYFLLVYTKSNWFTVIWHTFTSQTIPKICKNLLPPLNVENYSRHERFITLLLVTVVQYDANVWYKVCKFGVNDTPSVGSAWRLEWIAWILLWSENDLYKIEVWQFTDNINCFDYSFNRKVAHWSFFWLNSNRVIPPKNVFIT